MPVAQVREKVQRILTETYGSVSIDNDGDFFVKFGSAVVYINVFELNSGTTIVRSFAVMLRNVRLTPDVYRWVATEGQHYFFGHSVVREGENGIGTIIFEHALLGDFLDADELRWAVIALGDSADTLDDELQARFGGEKFVEG